MFMKGGDMEERALTEEEQAKYDTSRAVAREKMQEISSFINAKLGQQALVDELMTREITHLREQLSGAIAQLQAGHKYRRETEERIRGKEEENDELRTQVKFQLRVISYLEGKAGPVPTDILKKLEEPPDVEREKEEEKSEKKPEPPLNCKG